MWRGSRAQTGASIEQAAHDARHAVLCAGGRSGWSATVAVAHTRDDQAETFLLRLLRGAGPRGLGGMHPRSGLVDPAVSRDARGPTSARFWRDSRSSFREDASNADLDIPRNRIRHELIPFLRSAFSPGISRGAAIAKQPLRATMRSSWSDGVGRGSIAADADAGRASRSHRRGCLLQPRAVARRVIRDAQQIASGGRFVGFEAVEAVLAFAVSNSSGPLDLPGHRVNRRGGRIVLTRGDGHCAPRREDEPAAGRLRSPTSSDVPGQVRRAGGRHARFRRGRSAPGRRVGRRALAAGEPRRPGRGRRPAGSRTRLTVRNRRPGDSFRPLGSAGAEEAAGFLRRRQSA